MPAMLLKPAQFVRISLILGLLLAGLGRPGVAQAVVPDAGWGNAAPPIATPPAVDPPSAAAPAPPFYLFFPVVTQAALGFDGPDLPFGYGWGVFQWRNYWPANQQYPTTSFNWIKITENPDPAQLCDQYRLPYQVLLRLNKADAHATPQQVADDAWTWAQNLKAQAGRARCVDAFEIGNEPNLSMNGAYSGPVDAVQYADQLCAAYTAIKATDPGYVVVSAGLAPTAGLPDATQALTDTVFLRQMLDRIRDTHAGDAGACFDVLGYHNYGFSGRYDLDPADPACAERSCFRGVEPVFSLLYAEYGVRKRIWTTETGWTRDFTTGGCGAAPWAGVFAGFQRSDQGQAQELVGAYQYARAHWPWLGAIFVFNLDFDSRPQDPCVDEQGWFAVKGRAAEAALEAMPKP